MINYIYIYMHHVKINRFGERIHDFTAGTLHDHFINFKIDLDVGEVKNSVMQRAIEAVRFTKLSTILTFLHSKLLHHEKSCCSYKYFII